MDQFVWPELSTAGATSTARAIRLLASELTMEKMPRHGCPPVCILISDGACTDPEGDYDAAIAELLKLPWGRKAVRLAIGVGDESDYDEEELLKFVSHREIGVLKADSPGKLVHYITWASVAATVGYGRYGRNVERSRIRSRRRHPTQGLRLDAARDHRALTRRRLSRAGWGRSG